MIQKDHQLSFWFKLLCIRIENNLNLIFGEKLHLVETMLAQFSWNCAV